MDAVFKALADASRRRLLDSLNQRGGQSLRELSADLDMTRQAVAKHLAVLEAANLVTAVRRGRAKLHYLNAAPINDLADRWIGRYDRARLRALADLRQVLEETTVTSPATDTATDTATVHAFVYVTYIRTTPQRLWHALTEPAFIRRYFDGSGPESDWKVGSPVAWVSGGQALDLDQRVLACEPYRQLSYTWHNYQPQHAEMFGWTPERFAELVREPISRVTFDLEPAGPAVRLTVTHDGFEAETEMLRALRQGWPRILSSLKTLLETGDTLPTAP